MNNTMRRGWALVLTLLLHLALLATVLLARAPQPAFAPQAVSLRLLAPQLPAEPLRVERPAPTIPAPPAPSLLPLPAPVLIAAEPPAAAPPSPAVVPSLPPAPAAMLPVVARTEPAFQAAMPADRQCAAQGIARHYPPLLRERGIEGRVLLRVHVDERGRPVEIQVQAGSGYRLLDEAAQRLTQGCQFLPARRGEEPQASWVEYPVRFALN